MKKTIMLLLIVLFVFPVTIFAEKCDDAEIVRLKTAASKVEAKLVPVQFPELKGSADTEEEFVVMTNYFGIQVSNLDKDLDYKLLKGYVSIWDSDEYPVQKEKDTYRYNIVGEYDSVKKINLYISSKKCGGNVIRTIELTLPMRNVYYNYNMCSDVRDFYLCQEFWYQDYTGKDVNKEIEAYKNNKIDKNGKKKEKKSFLDKINSFVKKNYIIFIGVLALILGVGVVIFVRRRIRMKKHFG